MPRIEAAGRPMTGLGGSPYDGDGTWSVASTPYAGTAVPYAWQRGSSAPRLFRGPKLPSEWRCWRSSGGRLRLWSIRENAWALGQPRDAQAITESALFSTCLSTTATSLIERCERAKGRSQGCIVRGVVMSDAGCQRLPGTVSHDPNNTI